MENYFGPDIAETYDDPDPTPAARAELEHTVAVLHELAGDSAALEFAIGTGRVALPLAQAGTEVCGIEYSPDMLAVLRRKPGAPALRLCQGDMARTRIKGTFGLVFLVYNTIGNLTTQAQQVACFENAAAHLGPGGRFVIENLIPPLRRYPPGAPGVAFDVSPTHSGIDTFDTASQMMTSHHYTREKDGRIRYSAVPQRYTWPAELDLMARLAGFDLQERWGDWDRRDYDSTSHKHVSIWKLPK